MPTVNLCSRGLPELCCEMNKSAEKAVMQNSDEEFSDMKLEGGERIFSECKKDEWTLIVAVCFKMINGEGRKRFLKIFLENSADFEETNF